MSSRRLTDRLASNHTNSVADLPLAWRILHYANLYRLVVAGVGVVSFVLYASSMSSDMAYPRLFFAVANAYLFAGLLFLLSVSARWPSLRLQMHLHFLVDLVSLVLLIHAGGGVSAGVGVLLVMPLAAQALLAERKQALASAAQASLALLTEQVWSIWRQAGQVNALIGTGLLCAILFGVAGLSSVMGRRMRAAERHVARQRADLARLASISERMIQDVPDGVVVVDADETIRQINLKAQQMLGLTAQARGRSLSQVAPGIAEQLMVWKRLPAEAPQIPLEELQSEWRLHFIPIGHGTTVAMVIYIEDVARSRQEAQRIKLAALGRLTANIAHEIRNPLSAISHAAELLGEEALEAGNARLVNIIHDNAARLEKIVHDVLALNRYDRQNAEVLDIVAWLQSFADLFARVEALPPGGLQVESAGPATLIFDEQHLHQVLWNLCANAWRHGRHQAGSVILHLHQTGGRLNIDVIDDGAGISEAAVGKIFEPFFTTENSGSGLGLYIARELCQANGARLEALRSTRGTIFRISMEQS